MRCPTRDTKKSKCIHVQNGCNCFQTKVRITEKNRKLHINSSVVLTVHTNNKKVLLRERKRHTARRVAIAISCYSGGGGPLTNFFFFQSEHVSSQIWCQKIFPLLGGGGRGGFPRQKIFFFQSEHVSSQIWCQKNFPLLGGGGSLDNKIFFPF